MFFYDTTEVTKIVLPKVLQNLILFLLAQGTEPKSFFLFYHVTHNTGRDRLKGLSVFSHCATFFLEKNSPKAPFIFLQFSDRMDVEKSKRVPFQFFGIVILFPEKVFKTFSPIHQYFDTLKSFCFFLSLRYGADLGRSLLVCSSL